MPILLKAVHYIPPHKLGNVSVSGRVTKFAFSFCLFLCSGNSEKPNKGIFFWI